MKQYMIGLDIGTTAVKAVLFTTQGGYIDKETQHYPLHTPDVYTAEQDPDEILMKSMRALNNLVERNACGDEIAFVSCSAAMHSIILLDHSGERLTECITWADRRSEDMAEKWDDAKGLAVYRRTGTPIHPMSPFIKLLHFKEKAPEIYSQIGKIVGIKEYVLHHLTGMYEVDKSIASSMGMMDLDTSQWDSEVLELLDLTPKQLPDIVSTTKVHQSIGRNLGQTGLAKDTKIILGASDGVLANLGVNAIQEGDVAITIGTSGAIRTVITEPRTDPKMRTFCYHLTENRYVIGGSVNNGGVILRWIRDELCQEEVGKADAYNEDPYEVMTRAADNVSPGSNGLIFHPYLAGERAPLWNAKAVGSFYGLTLSHERSHMIRAALEGVVYNLYSVYLALREQMNEVKSIKASGGFARSEMWKQLMADVFGEQLTVPKSYESSAFGACLLGLYALGEIRDLNEVADFVGESDAYIPDEKVHLKYQEIMSVYIELGRALEPFYDRMDEIR